MHWYGKSSKMLSKKKEVPKQDYRMIPVIIF